MTVCLQTYPGADGLKTGYIDASGCNLVTSAVRGDVRMIGVVLGAQNGWERDTHMASLLDAGFERMGVPITHEEPRRPRSQGLIAAASAATLPASSMPPTWHRGARPVVHYAGARTFVREREAEIAHARDASRRRASCGPGASTAGACPGKRAPGAQTGRSRSCGRWFARAAMADPRPAHRRPIRAA